MNREELQQLREALDMSQKDMAAALDMSLKAYGSIELGHSGLRKVHILAIERIALDVAAQKSQPMIAPASVRRDALKIAGIMVGEYKAGTN